MNLERIGLVLLILILAGYLGFTGNVVKDFEDEGYGGPSAADMNCMTSCVSVGCDADNMECKVANSGACGKKCGVETERPEAENEGESCMQECISVGCNEYDVRCERGNVDRCEEKCDMKGDAPDESEMDAEQLCITNCVNEVDPMIRCGNSQEGETGGDVCQRCAASCVHLYEGPCLDDEGVTEKEKECETCEHCYGEPVNGPSGEGWDCIVDVKCMDASSEWGDEPGEGDASFEEGHEGPGIVENIGNFFKGLFGRD